MAGLLAGQIDDIATTTLADLGRFRWENISYDLQEHVAWSRLLQRDRVSFSSGESIDLNAKVVQGNQARRTGLYDTDNIQARDLMDKGNIPWFFYDTHFAYDVRENVFNRGAAEIVDIMQVRRNDAMVALAGIGETDFWGTPDTSANKKIYGIGYYLVKNATTGFNGGNPTGFTNVGGLDPDQYTNWKNWTFQYAAISQTDLLREVREACTKTNFMSPVAHPKYSGARQRFGHYMNYNIIQEVEEYLADNNENIGCDFGKYDGRAVFRGVPLTWVPKLEDESDDPWIGIDWNAIEVVFQRGQWMRYSNPRDVATSSHNVRAIYIDMIWNMRVTNRRRHFIGYK